jgi:hypothetical protein
LHKDSDAFVASIAEVIADIREPITVHQQSFGRDESRQLELKVRYKKLLSHRYSIYCDVDNGFYTDKNLVSVN